MAKQKDQFTIPDPELVPKLQTLESYSAEADTVARLGIAADDNTELNTVVTAFATAEGLMSNKNLVTKTMTKARDVARDAAVVVARKFAPKWYYNNTKAKPTDVLKAGLVPHADTRTPRQGGAIEIPNMAVDSVKGHSIVVTVTDAVGSEGKPVNIVFIRVRYFIVKPGTTVPVDPADFCKFTDNSRHPIVLTFPADTAGLPIAVSSCYVDAQGVEGGYSDVVNLNIT